MCREISKSNSLLITDEHIRQVLLPYRVSLTTSQVEAVRRYLSLLILWNQKINLTSVREPGHILERHFGESFFATTVVPFRQGRLADVGSGAGFPGLALKILLPALDTILIEPSRRKAAFLSEVTRSLQLTGTRIVSQRTEEFVPDTSMDYVTARALGKLPEMLRWARMALAKRGCLVLWLGRDDAEIVSKVDGWDWERPFLIPGSHRRMILVGHLRPD